MGGNETTLTRRTLLGTALLLQALPGLAAGRKAVRDSKRICLLTPGDGVDRHAFAQAWLGQARARPDPAAHHLVFSEVLPSVDGPIGAFVSLWSARDAKAAVPVIPGSRMTELPVTEHAFVPPDRGTALVKRTLLIVRRPGMTHDAFVRYWLGVHGPLSQAVPGLAGCVLNVLGERAAASSGIDGISESWWTGPGTEQGGKVASPQADRWAADGANFIDDAKTRLLISREHVLR